MEACGRKESAIQGSVRGKAGVGMVRRTVREKRGGIGIWIMEEMEAM